MSENFAQFSNLCMEEGRGTKFRIQEGKELDNALAVLLNVTHNLTMQMHSLPLSYITQNNKMDLLQESTSI